MGTGYSSEDTFTTLTVATAGSTSILGNLNVAFSPEFEEIGGEVLEDTLVPRRRLCYEAEYQELDIAASTTDKDVFPEQLTNLDILVFKCPNPHLTV